MLVLFCLWLGLALALAVHQWPQSRAIGARQLFSTNLSPVSETGSMTENTVSPRDQRDLFLLARPMVFARTSASDLDLLPGIGPELARRIIALRDQGLINSADELVRVPGISENRARQLAPLLTWDPPDHAAP